MKKICLFIAFAFTALAAAAQDCPQITRTELRQKLVELGYEVKDLEKTEGKQKYEVKMVYDGMNVPLGFEISPSGNFIWLTAFLGDPPSTGSTTNSDLLRQNAIIQPCQFYVTEKGRLMMGFAVENRGVTNAVLKKHADFITKRVVETRTYWQNKQ